MFWAIVGAVMAVVGTLVIIVGLILLCNEYLWGGP